jgi:hypothetical protein
MCHCVIAVSLLCTRLINLSTKKKPYVSAGLSKLPQIPGANRIYSTATASAFLAAVLLLTAAAVATVASKVMAPAETIAEKDNPANGGGYRLSEHIKQYYQTTRV